MNKKHGRAPGRLSAPRAGFVALMLAMAATSATAQSTLTDIAQTPLSTAQPNQVKPNLMFILDDSGSMSSDYMPDQANFSSARYGRYASQCNGLAYNPNTTYDLPVDSTGANLANGSYTFIQPSALANTRPIVSAAPTMATGTITVQVGNWSWWLTNSGYGNNRYVTLYSSTDTSRWMLGIITSIDNGNNRLTLNITETSGGSGTLASPYVGDDHHRPFFYTYTPTTGSPAPLSYTYTTSGVVNSTTFYLECDSVVGSSPGNARFSRVVVTPSYADLQNYANWYTYYRTRILTMRTATSRAFQTIGDRFRVGFSTISSRTVDGSHFLDIADFNATQKADFYTRLNTAFSGGWTPLRGAISKAGKYYAARGTVGGGGAQSYDPVQFSCQKNFAILTTDGYWNTNDEVSGNGSGSYGPDRLDNNDVGQQDGTADRPMLDGAVPYWTVTTPMSQVQHWLRTRAQTQTTTEQYTEYGSQSCGGGQRRVRSRLVTRTRDAVNTETSYYARTRTYNQVVPYTNGAAGTPTVTGETFGSYTPEGTTATSGLVNGSWGGWNNGSWSGYGACSAAAVPPNSAVTSSTGAVSGWSGYSGYQAANPAADAAVATGPAVESTHTSSGGNSNSLADVAMYYYNTDLRDTSLNNCTSSSSGANVCENNVPPRGSDSAIHQHMTTFTVGMGVNGTVRYASNYLSGGSSDYNEIVQGTRDWPDPITSTTAARIDDLWHAAVNGRGQYFSAGDPDTLAQGLNEALAAISLQTGSGSGAAASTLQPVQGDSTMFIARYTTVYWTGDILARTIDPTTAVVSTVDNWSAAALLDARVAAGTARNIFYMRNSGAGNTGTMRDFTDANLSTDSLIGLFDGACSKAIPLSQCSQSGYDVAGANSGASMVAYLRGAGNPNYRNRQRLLGDIVGGAPVYVRESPFRYTENNYASFVASLNAQNSGAGRTGVLYAAANDGMLHAFNGDTGQEMWAFIPSMVMDRMYRLADNDYANRHEFFVNGGPVIGDIYVGGSWKTILVGGLGAGGRGYYALDITIPESPQVLWEFTNDSLGGNGNLGLAFGNPVITKRANGTWVVAFTSGYNNVSPGDGNGHLFIVNANTGERIMTVSTETSSGVPAGTSTTPSGLGKLNAWIDSNLDNSARRFYAGDLLGNLWRFDIDNLVAPNQAALRLAYLRAGSPAVAQPITTQPTLGEVNYGGSRYPVVYVGTGRLLGLSDLTNTAVQSVYAIRDHLTSTGLGDVHASSNVVAQTISSPGANQSRTITNNAVDWTVNDGWRVDLIGAGERVNVNMLLLLRTLAVAANTPNDDACTAGGTSYLYQFDLSTGSSVPAANGVIGIWLGNSMSVGLSYVTLTPGGSTAGGAERGSGDTYIHSIGSDGQVGGPFRAFPNDMAGASGRRTSWRELVN